MKKKLKKGLLDDQTFTDSNGMEVVNAIVANLALVVTANDTRRKAVRTVCKICACGVKCEVKNGEGCNYLQDFIEELAKD